jgi:ABC-type sugar transport system ATPase subunit
MTIAVTDLVLRDGATPFTLSLVPGQITGLVGLEKNGQEEFLLTLCGLARPRAGSLSILGTDFPARGVGSLREAFRHGIAYLPRDRKTEGILASQSVLDNFSIATMPKYSRFGLVSPKRVRAEYDRFAAQLGIVCASPGSAIRTLSGGNQQKVLLARWLAAEPKVLLLNDPSRGVDHPTKTAMHDLYRRLAETGTAVVILSSEIEELLLVADSTVVFRDGSVQAVLDRSRMSRDSILTAMFGVNHD